MRRRGRVCGVVKWGGLVTALLFAVVWVGSRWAWVSRYSGDGDCGWTVAGGEFYASWSGRPEGAWEWSASPHVNLARGQFAWNGPSVRWGWTKSILIPLWLPAGVGVGVAAWAWRVEVVRRRLGPMSCVFCAYDRAGLGAACPCPECGRVPGA